MSLSEESFKIQEWLLEFTVIYNAKVWASRFERFVMSVVKHALKEKKYAGSLNIVEV